jgi:adenosine deaminase
MHDPEYAKNLNKADLHVHLNGSVPANIVASLVEKYEIDLPEGFSEEKIVKDLVITKPVLLLPEYFRPWLVLKRLPKGKACLQEMIRAVLGNLKKDNITYAELRNSPFNISEINNISLEDTLSWLIEEIAVASSKYQVMAKLIISFSRFRFDLKRANELMQAVKLVNDGTILGFDLSGNEDDPIPFEACEIFRRAKDDLGLSVSIHAGETGKLENVLWAINDCKADRIAHALAATKSPEALEEIRDRNICVEVCLTSNYLTGLVKDLHEHPVITFIENNIPFVLCSDNPQTNNSILSDEYSKFIDITGRRDLIAEMYGVQLRYSFSKGDLYD